MYQHTEVWPSMKVWLGGVLSELSRLGVGGMEVHSLPAHLVSEFDQIVAETRKGSRRGRPTSVEIADAVLWAAERDRIPRNLAPTVYAICLAWRDHQEWLEDFHRAWLEEGGAGPNGSLDA